MKKPSSTRLITIALGLACCVSANNAKAANSQYFTTVVNNGTYSWDAANWNASPASGNTGPYTFNWVQGDFARFYNGASDAYTVTVNASEQNAGMYLNAASATLNINDAGGGNGSLSEVSGVDAFLLGGSSYAETIKVNVPITGSGTVAPEGSGNLYLNVANSYTGGTALGDSGNTLTYFNNANAFGSGGITLNRTGIANFSTLLNNAGTSVTLANNFSIASAVGTGTGLNFASGVNSPVVSSGTWTLGTYNLNLRTAGGATAPLTISGAISGSGILALSGNQGGDSTGSKIILSGANPFTGTIIVTGTGGTYGGNGAITLTLGARNTISHASNVTMAGGTLDPDGFDQAMQSTTLGLTASSTIDFSAGASEVELANSSALTWTGILNLVGFDTSVDALRFGTDVSGLTSAQLGKIEFNGGGLGTAELDGNGFLMIPEPSTALLGLLGGLGILWNIRRRKA